MCSDLGLWGHSCGGCGDLENGKQGRLEIRAANICFDVIKRNSPQPVDDITDCNLHPF